MADSRQQSSKSRSNENKNFQKIQFRIVSVSSEEEGYPSTELLNHTPFSKGWQSSRFCDYPQEITIETNSVIKLGQIQFLSHQFKISSKIEILIYNPPSTEMKKPGKFKKVGYLSLDPNEKSNYKARELKSVFLEYQCKQVKILLHRCHTNIHNPYNQIGLIAINLLGHYETSAGDFVNENYLLKDKIDTKLEDEMIYDQNTLKRLKTLYKAKEKAIELEDYDEAKKITESINRLKSVSQQLIQLEERKQLAIKNDDFDAAKMLKYEIERLRDAVAGVNMRGPFGNDALPTFKRDDDVNTFGNQQNAINERKLGPKKVIQKNDADGLGGGYPITSELILEEEEKLNKVKNIKTGYGVQNKNDLKIRNQIEEQQVKGNGDFNKLLKEQLEKEGIHSDFKVEVDEDISANEYKKAEPLIPIISYEVIKLIFAKPWKNKEEGIRIITEEVKNHPKSQILGNHQVDQILVAIMGVCAVVLSCNVSQVLITTMDLIKISFNKFRGVNIGGYLKSDFNQYVDNCLMHLLEKIGDPNLKLKEKSENTVLEMANNSLIGHKVVYEHLIKGQVKKQLAASIKHISGRLNLITRMIENFGLDSNDVPISVLLDYAITSYKNPNKEVRDAAFNLIMNCYKYIGDSIRNYFKDLRPQQIQSLEDGFSSLDQLGEEIQSNPTKQKAQNHSLKNSDNEQEENPENFDSSEVNQSQMLRNFQPDDPTKCFFCGIYDPNFDEDALDMHQYKDCPMLYKCTRCGVTVEISTLNYHYLNECKFKNEFKLHQRCKEAVHNSQYEKHDSEKICNIAKNPNNFNRCPLCHQDVSPAGKVGWEVHLLQDGCMYNPRSTN